MYIEISGLNARIKELEIRSVATNNDMKESRLREFDTNIQFGSHTYIYENDKMKKQIEKFHEQKDRL